MPMLILMPMVCDFVRVEVRVAIGVDKRGSMSSRGHPPTRIPLEENPRPICSSDGNGFTACSYFMTLNWGSLVDPALLIRGCIDAEGDHSATECLLPLLIRPQ